MKSSFLVLLFIVILKQNMNKMLIFVCRFVHQIIEVQWVPKDILCSVLNEAYTVIKEGLPNDP